MPWVQFVRCQCQWYICQVHWYVAHTTVFFVKLSLLCWTNSVFMLPVSLLCWSSSVCMLSMSLLCSSSSVCILFMPLVCSSSSVCMLSVSEIGSSCSYSWSDYFNLETLKSHALFRRSRFLRYFWKRFPTIGLTKSQVLYNLMGQKKVGLNFCRP